MEGLQKKLRKNKGKIGHKRSIGLKNKEKKVFVDLFEANFRNSLARQKVTSTNKNNLARLF